VLGEDKVDMYLLIATSYDTSMATILRPTSVHVVCSNTLSYALAGGSGHIAISHASKVDWDQLKKDMGMVRDGQKIFEDEVNLLAEHTVDLDVAISFFREILGPEAVKIDEHGTPQYSQSMKKLFACYELGMGQQQRSMRHTSWGLINAVTQFQDYEVGARNNGSRMNSAWFGAGAHRKKHAYDLAKEVAGIVSEAA
jgi:phage/plasmid-like protein (TIGR03299 family)